MRAAITAPVVIGHALSTQVVNGQHPSIKKAVKQVAAASIGSGGASPFLRGHRSYGAHGLKEKTRVGRNGFEPLTLSASCSTPP